MVTDQPTTQAMTMNESRAPAAARVSAALELLGSAVGVSYSKRPKLTCGKSRLANDEELKAIIASGTDSTESDASMTGEFFNVD